MALFMFVELFNDKGKKINVFNRGNMSRDFTYIDDIVNGVVNVLKNQKVLVIKKKFALFNF